jgi:small-conductance mechanosensitive channel
MEYLKKIIIPLLFLAATVSLELVLKFDLLPIKQFNNVLESISIIGIIVSVSWCLIALLGVVKMVLLNNYDLTKDDNLHSRKIYTQFNIIERVIIFVIIIFAIGVIFMSFDGLKEIGVSLFASAGLAGLVIGLAAQKVISSLLAGIQIAITQPIRIEDVVVVEGEWGRIEEITLTYVVVRIWDKRRLVVPSTYFMEKPFQNWTKDSAEILGTVFFYADYTMPLDLLRKEFERIIENHPAWDKQVKTLTVTNLQAMNIEIRAVVSAKNATDAWELRTFIRENMLYFIQTNYPESLPKTRIEIAK